MARRGRCRCGNVLTFQRGPDGYKVRCPVCKAVVRLSTADAPKPPAAEGHCTACGAPVAAAPGESLVLCAACRGAVGDAVARIPVAPVLPPPEPLPPLPAFGLAPSPPPPVAAARQEPRPPGSPPAPDLLVETTPYHGTALEPLPGPPTETPAGSGRRRMWLVWVTALLMSAVLAALIWLCRR
jgi:hypothetical protein